VFPFAHIKLCASHPKKIYTNGEEILPIGGNYEPYFYRVWYKVIEEKSKEQLRKLKELYGYSR
jgi:hypothetical protein